MDISSFYNTGYEALFTGISAVILAQITKFFVHLIWKRKVDLRLFTTTGGMPSSHSAGVIGLSTTVGLICGFSSIEFAMAIGYALVVEHSGDISRNDAELFVCKARNVQEKDVNKILIKGNATVTYDAARVFAHAGVELIGNESQTVGPEDSPKQVHLELLQKNIVLLEGIRLSHVPEGVYLLSAAPLNLGGGDGAPCRAVLIEL